MSELRKDPVLNRWVVVAPEQRARRPEFPRATLPEQHPCPLCPGQERLTPPEIRASSADAHRPANSPGWDLRVIPNREPILRVEGELQRRREGPLEAISGIGAHEIIVESPEHERDLPDLSADRVASVLWAWSERLRDLSNDVRLLAAAVFRDRGIEAGARLAHPHSQLVALPVIPSVLAAELAGAAAYYQAQRRCAWCDVVHEELALGSRVVLESERAVVLAPWASRRPFELVLIPRAHGASFEQASRELIDDVATLLRRALRRLMIALESPAWSLILHTAPLREQRLGHYHWHFEIVPAVGHTNGLEPGSGVSVNPVLPENAASFLRALTDD